MGNGLCEHCGHVASQCQCGTLQGEGSRGVQVDFLKLFVGWWSKAKRDAEARHEAKMKDGSEGG